MSKNLVSKKSCRDHKFEMRAKRLVRKYGVARAAAYLRKSYEWTRRVATGIRYEY